MSSFNTRPNSLEALVRTALINKELAPGVALRIEPYRAQLALGKLPEDDKRLLAVLDDAIADKLVTVIAPEIQPSTIQDVRESAVAQPHRSAGSHFS